MSTREDRLDAILSTLDHQRTVGVDALSQRDDLLTELTIVTNAVDCTFVGVHTISADAGGMTANEDEASVNHLMARRGKQAVAVADSSKYGYRAFASVGRPEIFHTIITDDRIKASAHADLTAVGCDVDLALTGDGATGQERTAEEDR